MLIPFQKESLAQERFVRDAVRFNLLHTISGGECAVALQTGDGGDVALANPGLNMWLWLDEACGNAYAAEVIDELADRLKDARLPGVVATPENAWRFCEAYCRKGAASCTLRFSLMSYACNAVKTPSGVPGVMKKAEKRHAETVADFLCGFTWDCFHTEENREVALTSALDMISAGKVLVWEAYGKTVCMASILRRSARHDRIGHVYTPPEERNKGYASALVAAASRQVLGEGLTPMLYADVANPASNKAYRNIGYIASGQVDEYGFLYENG